VPRARICIVFVEGPCSLQRVRPCEGERACVWSGADGRHGAGKSVDRRQVHCTCQGFEPCSARAFDGAWVYQRQQEVRHAANLGMPVGSKMRATGAHASGNAAVALGQTNDGHCQCLPKFLGVEHGDLPPAPRARWPRWRQQSPPLTSWLLRIRGFDSKSGIHCMPWNVASKCSRNIALWLGARPGPGPAHFRGSWACQGTVSSCNFGRNFALEV